MKLIKSRIIADILDSKIVAVVRGENSDMAYKTAKACINGEVKAIEVTFTVPRADKVIAQLVDEYIDDETVVIGAGTVLDPVTARIAIVAGASFIVSPSFNEEVAKMCNLYQVPYIPGCATVTEVQNAMTFGAEIIKEFSGSVMGPEFIKSIKAPLPQVNIMPTGGVKLENMREWFEAGAIVVGTGSHLTGPAEHGDYQQVEKNARQYHELAEKIFK